MMTNVRNSKSEHHSCPVGSRKLADPLVTSIASLEKLFYRDYILFFSFVEQEEDQFDLFDRISSIFLSRRQLFISASRFDASERFG